MHGHLASYLRQKSGRAQFNDLCSIIPAAAHHLIVLQDITWSSTTTRAEVRRRAADLSINIAPDDALPCLQDIDTVQVRP